MFYNKIKQKQKQLKKSLRCHEDHEDNKLKKILNKNNFLFGPNNNNYFDRNCFIMSNARTKETLSFIRDTTLGDTISM